MLSAWIADSRLPTTGKTCVLARPSIFRAAHKISPVKYSASRYLELFQYPPPIKRYPRSDATELKDVFPQEAFPAKLVLSALVSPRF